MSRPEKTGFQSLRTVFTTEHERINKSPIFTFHVAGTGKDKEKYDAAHLYVAWVSGDEDYYTSLQSRGHSEPTCCDS